MGSRWATRRGGGGRAEEGSVEYRLPDSLKRQVEFKTIFFRRMDAGVLCGVGAFRPL